MKYAAPYTLALRASLIAKVCGWYIAWRQRRATDGHSAKPSVGPRDHARVCGGKREWDPSRLKIRSTTLLNVESTLGSLSRSLVCVRQEVFTI